MAAYWVVTLRGSLVVFLTVSASIWKGSISGTSRDPLLGASALELVNGKNYYLLNTKVVACSMLMVIEYLFEP
jgi:hypothetical protein